MNKDKVSIIIPAYQPDEKLNTTVKELITAGFSDIIVVNDGSAEECKAIFKEVEEFAECTVLVHPVNRGKGAALKTAFAYVVENRPEALCVVTADADGQHLVMDIVKVSMAALNNGRVVFGVRDFSDPGIPSRSRMGNGITSMVFRMFLGMKLQDTQTGLRAFPTRYLPELIKVEGDRYEYETNMLFFMNKQSIPYEQTGITTVYIDENKSSHFRVIRDSLRIYALILKYLFSSVAASVLDELAFYIFKRFALLSVFPIPLTFTASFLARAVSSIVNYLINAKMVFHGETSPKTLVRYYTLAVVQIIASATLVFGIELILRITAPELSMLVKIVVDTILFFLSFRIQHKWVFNKKK